jgi:hypothetical protein
MLLVSFEKLFTMPLVDLAYLLKGAIKSIEAATKPVQVREPKERRKKLTKKLTVREYVAKYGPVEGRAVRALALKLKRPESSVRRDLWRLRTQKQ